MYTTAAGTSAYLGRTLTAAQTTQATALVPAAQAWIDRRAGRTWEQTAAIVGELHTLEGRLVYVTTPPIASVQAVAVRSFDVGSVDTTLVSGTGYEVLDTANGALALPGYTGWLAKISYTPSVPVPADIALAAAMLVAYWLGPTLDGNTPDVKRYSVGQELTVEFRDGPGGVPAHITALVDRYRKVVFA